MKISRSVLAPIMTVVFICSSASLVHATEIYRLDPDHTSIVFRVKHLNVAYVFGSFSKSSGMIRIDEDDPSQNVIEMQVRADSVATHVNKRDKHLRSPDFFDIRQHPAISFKSQFVKPIDNSSYEVMGELTLLGKKRSIVVTVSETGSGKGPWGNFRKGFNTSFSVHRSDFGMNTMQGAVADTVDITVSSEGIRQEPK